MPPACAAASGISMGAVSPRDRMQATRPRAPGQATARGALARK